MVEVVDVEPGSQRSLKKTEEHKNGQEMPQLETVGVDIINLKVNN